LTAAVSPNVSGRVALADPAIRLRQYQIAISEWSRSTLQLGFRLAVVETTGASPKDLLQDVGEKRARRISVVSFEPSAVQAERGKGAVELAAIRAAVEDAELVAPNDTLYKCTGRLIVRNAGRILTPLRTGAVKVRMTLDRSWADTRLVGATAQTWSEHIFPDIDLVDDARGRYLERVLAARLASASTLGSVSIEQFSGRPLLSGVSGSTGKSYLARTSWLKDRALRPFETLLSGIASKKQV
jgi:hypothetical protein